MRCLRVEVPPRTFSRRRQSPRSLLREFRVEPTELGLVAGGLLEVIAEDLVQLHEALAMHVEPSREAVVQVGTGRLRERVVRRVAQQEVAEAVAVLAGRQRAGRPNELRGRGR